MANDTYEQRTLAEFVKTIGVIEHERTKAAREVQSARAIYEMALEKQKDKNEKLAIFTNQNERRISGSFIMPSEMIKDFYNRKAFSIDAEVGVKTTFRIRVLRMNVKGDVYNYDGSPDNFNGIMIRLYQHYFVGDILLARFCKYVQDGLEVELAYSRQSKAHKKEISNG